MFDNEMLTTELIRTQAELEKIKTYLGDQGSGMFPFMSAGNLSQQVTNNEVEIITLNTKIDMLEKELFAVKRLDKLESM